MKIDEAITNLKESLNAARKSEERLKENLARPAFWKILTTFGGEEE